jgi:hypothetical protein
MSIDGPECPHYVNLFDPRGCPKCVEEAAQVLERKPTTLEEQVRTQRNLAKEREEENTQLEVRLMEMGERVERLEAILLHPEGPAGSKGGGGNPGRWYFDCFLPQWEAYCQVAGRKFEHLARPEPRPAIIERRSRWKEILRWMSRKR